MDPNLLEALKGIENAISIPRYYDWWILVIAVANVLVFAFLTGYIAKLNKKVSKNQDDLQKRNLKLQLFEKRYPICYAIVKSKSGIKIDIYDLNNEIRNKIDKDVFKNTLYWLQNEISSNFALSKYLFDMNFVNKLDNLNAQFQNIFIQYEKIEYEYSTCKDRIDFIYSKLASLKIFSYNKDKDTQIKELKEVACNNNLVNELIIYSEYVDKYVKYIEDNNILEEFQKYLNVHDLEK